jgi:hypothetical protein
LNALKVYSLINRGNMLDAVKETENEHPPIGFTA